MSTNPSPKVTYSSHQYKTKGWRAGAGGSERNGTTENFLTRLTHRENCQPESGFNVTAGCNHSARARGIPTRTCREIMHEYSSLRISRGRSERFVDEPKPKPTRYRSVDFYANSYTQAHISLLGWDQSYCVSQRRPKRCR